MTAAPGVPRALFWHAESECYIEARGQKEIDEWWSHDDGLLSDVTGVVEHEDAFLKRGSEDVGA